MNILVNAIPLKGLLTGISRYVRQLYTELEKLPGVRVFYFDGLRLTDQMPPQANAARWSSFTRTVWTLPDSMVFLLRLLTWYNYERRLRTVCRSRAFDIYHETTFFPAAMRTVPQVQTIYDLSLLKYASAHPKERIMYFNFFNGRRMHFAAHRIAISEFIRDEVCGYFKMNPETVTSVHLAAAASFSRRTDAEIKAVLKAMSLPDEFLLFVGSMEPRKNLPLLIEALKAARTSVPLVLTGWEGWGSKEWLRQIKGSPLADRILITGYTTDEQLACLYSAATALVYPSLYEGFGLPVLEAMACGCPVISSNAASLTEVAGDAAILVDPSDSGALTNAIEQIALDNGIRRHYSEMGLARSSKFTWMNTAEKTLDVFRNTLPTH